VRRPALCRHGADCKHLRILRGRCRLECWQTGVRALLRCCQHCRQLYAWATGAALYPGLCVALFVCFNSTIRVDRVSPGNTLGLAWELVMCWQHQQAAAVVYVCRFECEASMQPVACYLVLQFCRMQLEHVASSVQGCVMCSGILVWQALLAAYSKYHKRVRETLRTAHRWKTIPAVTAAPQSMWCGNKQVTRTLR
jgi:hypothetical protein